MKKITLALFALLTAYAGYAQTTVLTKPEAAKLFPDNGGLPYPIRLVYKYADKTGTYYLPLCEKTDEIKDNDTAHWKIKAVNYVSENGGLKKVWELNDNILTAQMEESMWFFTKYTAIKDLDGDGIMDPVIVYGSTGPNGLGDGREKILIYYKGKKVAIRHQNSETDGARETDVDESFYALPAKIQEYVKGIMRKLAAEDNAIFAPNWESMMAKKKTLIN
jgi:hypothetical protein